MITLSARIAFLSTAVLALVACSSITIEPPAPIVSTPVPNDAVLVGAARTNLAPPPGYAMGGHGIGGTTAVGRWNDLSSRAIAITDTQGESVIFVALDAWSVSQGFVARVLDRIRQRPDLKFVRADQLIVSATHSHHTPGHVATSPIYNHFAQTDPGFDEPLFDHLAERVAESVASAWEARVAARLELRYGDLEGLARNRSFDAFLANPGMGSVSSPERQPAIDNRLRSLWAVAENGAVISILAVVPIHPVTMPARTPVYHPDFFGIASRDLEDELSSRDHAAVVAIINGAEGDQSPTWQWQGLPEAVRLGRELAHRIRDGVTETTLHPRIRTANTQFRLAGTNLDGLGRVSSFAMSGAAQLAGAEDGRTSLSDTLWFREGASRRYLRIPWQGAKKPVLPVVWPVLNVLYPAPKSIPLNVVRIDDRFALVTLPGEFTTQMGRSIEAHLVDNTSIERVWPLGLTNAYLSYFTTPEEYSMQHYEGGSMLYGPLAGIAIRERLLELSQSDSSAEYAERFRTGRRLREERDYPGILRDQCCDASGQLNESCPAMALLGIPSGFDAQCAGPGASRNPMQEDIRFLSLTGDDWVLRVTVP